MGDGLRNLLRRKPWEDGILVVSSSGGEGEARRLFDGADTTGEIRFTSVRPQRKQNRRILFTFGMSCPWGPSKTSERAQPGPSGIYYTEGYPSLNQ